MKTSRLPAISEPTASRPTLRDLARSLNVSHTTVSRVLSGQGADYISEQTRSRVIEAARQMRYRPNRAARTLATGKTGLISLWMGDLFRPYYVRTMQHVTREIEGTGYETVVYHIRSASVSPASLFTAADGLLVHDWGEVVESYLEYEPYALPLVSMGVQYTERTDFVGIDVYPGAVAAMQHLVATGRKRIVFVSHHARDGENEVRYRAYCEVMTQAGLPSEVVWVDLTRTACRETVRDYLAGNAGADALFCLSDDIAIAAYRAAHDCGQRVPEDIALVGCDDIEETQYLETTLSTISLPIPEMCRIATQFLQNRIADPTIARQQIILSPTFLKRDSS
ncbi:MAG: LacI family DNA-binding transcriptional regulator [Armatimonadetes bacterium]|nr:LacI family DNA-binding transcriptional regulator [Armatimonadota bacterium]